MGVRLWRPGSRRPAVQSMDGSLAVPPPPVRWSGSGPSQPYRRRWWPSWAAPERLHSKSGAGIP
jgi:hypothetical protein